MRRRTWSGPNVHESLIVCGLEAAQLISFRSLFGLTHPKLLVCDWPIALSVILISESPPALGRPLFPAPSHSNAFLPFKPFQVLGYHPVYPPSITSAILCSQPSTAIMASLPHRPAAFRSPIQPAQPPRPVEVKAWANDAAEALRTVHVTPMRGTSVTIAIPLDEETVSPPRVKKTPRAQVDESEEATLRRRDSLKRREALLKGKEGSRRRQRWENGELHFLLIQPLS